MWSNKKRSIILVHQLVAKYFIDIPNNINRLTVDHINNDKNNNTVSNLQWLSLEDNSLKRWDDNNLRKFKEKDIKWIRKNFLKGSLDFGIRALARKFNVDRSTIKCIVDKITYKWVK